jgi:hypothetical protein
LLDALAQRLGHEVRGQTVSPGEFAHADDARLSELLVRLGGDGVEKRRRDELALHERHAVGCVRRQSPGAALAVHDVHVQRRL